MRLYVLETSPVLSNVLSEQHVLASSFATWAMLQGALEAQENEGGSAKGNLILVGDSKLLPQQHLGAVHDFWIVLGRIPEATQIHGHTYEMNIPMRWQDLSAAIDNGFDFITHEGLPQRLVFGEYELDTKRKTLSWRASQGHTPVQLTDREAAVLAYLHQREGQLVSRGDLLSDVWGYHPETDTHTVETHIYRLRQKIEPDPSRPILILSHEGAYRLGPFGLGTELTD